MILGRFRPAHVTLLAVFALITLLISLNSWLSGQHQEQYRSQLQKRANAAFNTLQTPFRELNNQLVALRSLIELKPNLSRSEFDYFTSQQPISAYGIAAFEWLPVTTLDTQQQLIDEARKDGIFDFRFRQRSRQQTFYPIYYTSSAQMNGLTLGRDLSAIPALKRAMQLAQSSGTMKIGISSNTALDETEGDEVRFFMPVYLQQAGSQRLYGFVTAMIRYQEAINILLGNRVNQVSGLGLRMHDISSDNSLIYDTLGSKQQLNPLRIIQFDEAMGGHSYRYTFYDLSAEQPLAMTSYGGTILGVALFGSMMIVLLHNTLQAKVRVDELVACRTESLHLIEHEYQTLLQKVIEGVYRASLQGRFIKVNPALAKAFGYKDPEHMLEDVACIAQTLHRDKNEYARFLERLKKDGEVTNYEWEGVTKTGETIWLSENAYLCQSEQGETIYEGTLNVITERKLNEQQLSYQARHDSLTGLLNRAAFMEAFDQRLAAREKGVILFFDVDGFKKINDTLGHAIGDQFLIELSQRLKHCLRDQDLVARFGGDEFVVFVSKMENLAVTETLAKRIQREIARVYRIDGVGPFEISASIGINFIDDFDIDAEQALQQADVAMYAVKNNGKAAHLVFSNELDLRAQRQNQLETQLHHALGRQELDLLYQPVVDMRNGKITGFEALLRWQNPKLGSVSPAEFIPLAEEQNLIVPMGEWVIHQSLRALAVLQQNATEQLTMNINLSPLQLMSPNLSRHLNDALQANELHPGQVHLEVTETALYGQQQQAIQQLHELRNNGFCIYIDDFGTGHSSLERLVNFPACGFKIDRSFVRDAESDFNKKRMIQGLLALSDLLELEVIAEGIESEGAQETLLAAGCFKAQGYYYHRPTPLNQLTNTLRQQAA